MKNTKSIKNEVISQLIRQRHIDLIRFSTGSKSLCENLIKLEDIMEYENDLLSKRVFIKNIRRELESELYK